MTEHPDAGSTRRRHPLSRHSGSLAWRSGHFAALLLALAPAGSLAVDASWIATDGSYDEASNWDIAAVPLNDGVTYDVTLSGSGNQVTYDTGLAGAVDSLSLGAGVTFVTDGAGSAYTTAVTVANDATLIAEDQSSLALGGGDLDRSSLIARKGFLGAGGATLTTGVTSWTGTNGFNLDRSFTADGTGTLLDLSSLSNVERSGGSTYSDLNISATDGGRVDLTGIAAFADHASGTNGRINISASGNGSQVDLANLAALAGADVTVDDTAGVDLGSLGAFAGGTIALQSGDGAAPDVHVAAAFTLGDGGVVEAAGGSAALVVGPGTPVGAADGSLTVATGGSLFGTGTVVGALVNQGLIGPGSSPGTLVVDGDYQQDGGAILAIELGGSIQGSEFDLVSISGQASLGGDVEVTLVDGFLPTLGETFVFLEAAGGVNGLFENLFCTNCGSGIGFDLVHGPDFASLTAVPLPGAVWLLGPALGLLLTAARRRG